MLSPLGNHEMGLDVIVPCSMKTLAAISSSTRDDLLSRTGDVMLKEPRKAILVTRGTCPAVEECIIFTIAIVVPCAVLPR